MSEKKVTKKATKKTTKKVAAATTTKGTKKKVVLPVEPDAPGYEQPVPVEPQPVEPPVTETVTIRVVDAAGVVTEHQVPADEFGDVVTSLMQEASMKQMNWWQKLKYNVAKFTGL